MSRESVVLLLGILLLIIPQLGIPDIWKETFFVGAGIVLVVLGYSLRHSAFLRSIEQTDGERSTDSFVESTRMIDWNHPNNSAE